jgi:hypothetical protein
MMGLTDRCKREVELIVGVLWVQWGNSEKVAEGVSAHIPYKLFDEPHGLYTNTHANESYITHTLFQSV